MWQNSKTQIVTNSKTKIGTKLKISNCDKTKKNQIVTKLSSDSCDSSDRSDICDSSDCGDKKNITIFNFFIHYYFFSLQLWQNSRYFFPQTVPLMHALISFLLKKINMLRPKTSFNNCLRKGQSMLTASFFRYFVKTRTLYAIFFYSSSILFLETRILHVLVRDAKPMNSWTMFV